MVAEDYSQVEVGEVVEGMVHACVTAVGSELIRRISICQAEPFQDFGQHLFL